MKKRVLGVLLLLVLVLTLIPTNAQAKEVTIYPDYYWDLDLYWKYYDIVILDRYGEFVGSVKPGQTIDLDAGFYTAIVYYGDGKSYTTYFDYDGKSSTYFLGRNGMPNGYYPYYDYITSVRVYKDKVTGVTEPRAEVALYNDLGRVGLTTADKYGNFSIGFNFADYYYFNENWYNLDSFYLRSNGGAKYYLNSGYVDGFYDYDLRFSTNPMAGDNYINGYWAYPYATITVRDAQNYYLGSGTAASDGSFSISLNRKLIAGETLKLTYGNKNYYNRTATVVVGNLKNPERLDKVVSKFVIGEKTYTETKYDITKVEKMDVAPYLENGRTMLPLRYVAQSLGFDVNWDEATKNAVFIKGSDTAVVNLYSKEIYVNGRNYMLSVQPVTVNGRIMLPVSEVGMALGLSHGNYGQGKNIEWQASTQSVIITIYQ